MLNNFQKQLLGSYLGIFAKTIPQEHLELFRKDFPKLETMLVVAPYDTLISLGRYLLLEFGKQNYSLIFSNDILDIAFGNQDESCKHMNITHFTSKVVIVICPKHTPPNKLLGGYLAYMATELSTKGKTVVFLSEKIFPEIREVPDLRYYNMNSKEIVALQELQVLKTPKVTDNYTYIATCNRRPVPKDSLEFLTADI